MENRNTWEAPAQLRALCAQGLRSGCSRVQGKEPAPRLMQVSERTQFLRHLETEGTHSL